jgi:putative ABC transport system permease protein
VFESEVSMNYVALKMLTGDRAKYLGLIFAIAFSSFLIAHQASIFSGIMDRTRSQIKDISDADIWVMDPHTEYFDEINALTENDLYRVRGVSGVKWAVPLFKGQPRAKTPDGTFRVVILLGLDDATLVGAPRKMLMGSVGDLRQPDAAIIDWAGYQRLFPNEPLQTGKTLEMNDHRVRLVGICDASSPFFTAPVIFSRYSQARTYVGRERNLLSFVLVKPEPNVPVAELARRITHATGLAAMSGEEFGWATIMYFIRNTGIPVNFGMTVLIALIVGTVVAGQTFYIFTIENLKQFGALKAVGVTDRRIVGMILLQALVVGGIGYALGMGMAATFFAIFIRQIQTRGINILPEVMLGSGVVVIFIVLVASLMSIRKVLVLEPAIVFRG